MRRAISLFVSAALLVFIYLLIDFSTLIDAMRAADIILLITGIVAVVPLTLATAWRFSVLTGAAKIGILESGRLILAASTLNLFLPSKMGDIAKAAVLVHRHRIDGKLALSITVFEKVLDLASLLLLGVVALIHVASDSIVLWALAAMTAMTLLALTVVILPFGICFAVPRLAERIFPKRLAAPFGRFTDVWRSMVLWYWSDWRRAVAVIVLSVAIWGGHLMQFWIFALAIGAAIPVFDNMAFATLGILAGLLPFTIAGIGSRDAALIYFYGSYLSPGQGALLGILATLRYIIPGIVGVPFVSQKNFPTSGRRVVTG